MEAQGGAGNPEANKDIQDLLKPSNSGDLATEPSHNPSGEEESGIVVSNSGLLQITERRQPLSSVSSLEVHFDLLDLTDFTDISDQELVEVFADSDDENRNESPARYRIRKGEGFADMEYAMMVSMGAVTHSTVVVTIVHDCQVVDIPEDLIESHDLTVDYVLPPTRVIQTECRHPKPQGIIWAKQGAQHRAFLDYSGREAAEAALAALQGLSIDGTGLQAELAKSQRSSRKPGQTWSRATTGLAEAQNPSLT